MRFSIEPDEGFTPSPYPLPRRGEGNHFIRHPDESLRSSFERYTIGEDDPDPGERLRHFCNIRLFIRLSSGLRRLHRYDWLDQSGG